MHVPCMSGHALAPRAVPCHRDAVRVVLQRVREASVTVEGTVTGSVGVGFLLLVGVAPGDTTQHRTWMARKIAGLRVFEDDAGKMNLALGDVGGEVLAVSQFTLFGDVSKGRRPGFGAAAHPDEASPAFDEFCELLRGEGVAVATGVFGEHMDVRLHNDGPVTLILEYPPPQAA